MRSMPVIVAASAVLVSASLPARAETWIVRSAGVVSCRDLGAITRLLEKGALEVAAITVTVPGCAILDSGERLIYEPELGGGFSDFMRVQRRDGSVVHVKASALVKDPACGTLGEDRAGQ